MGQLHGKGLKEYLSKNELKDAGESFAFHLKLPILQNFLKRLRQIIEIDPPLPDSLAGIEEKTENYISLENNYETLKEFILKHI